MGIIGFQKMYCNKCGIELRDDDKFCSSCGNNSHDEVIGDKNRDENHGKWVHNYGRGISTFIGITSILASPVDMMSALDECSYTVIFREFFLLQ